MGDRLRNPPSGSETGARRREKTIELTELVDYDAWLEKIKDPAILAKEIFGGAVAPEAVKYNDKWVSTGDSDKDTHLRVLVNAGAGREDIEQLVTKLSAELTEMGLTVARDFWPQGNLRVIQIKLPTDFPTYNELAFGFYFPPEDKKK